MSLFIFFGATDAVVADDFGEYNEVVSVVAFD